MSISLLNYLVNNKSKNKNLYVSICMQNCFFFIKDFYFNEFIIVICLSVTLNAMRIDCKRNKISLLIFCSFISLLYIIRL